MIGCESDTRVHRSYTDAVGGVQAVSHQYEHDLVNEMYYRTPSNVKVYPCGFSGSNAIPQPDILLTDVRSCHAIEAKGTIQTDRVDVEPDDIEQLLDCANSYTQIYLVVKFSRREPVVVRYVDELKGGQEEIVDEGNYNDLDPAEKFAVLAPDAFNPHTTDGKGSLVLEKPDTDDWPSATAGADDADAVLSGLGISTNKSVEATL